MSTNDVRVRLKIQGVREVLKDRRVYDELERVGREMAADAGPGFEMVSKPHRHTSRAFVQTIRGNRQGRVRQARDHVLQRVVGSRAR